MTSTPNINLELPTFDEVTWHDAVNGNFEILDAAIHALSGLSISGIWQNATLYTVGLRVIDSITGTVWAVLVEHTSPSTGTFAEYRSDNPTHWDEIGVTSDPVVRTVTAAGDIDVTATDDVILVNKSIGAATNVNLPLSVDRGRVLKVVDLKGDAQTNNITLVPVGAELIIGASTFVVNTNNGSVEVHPRPDGLGWYI